MKRIIEFIRYYSLNELYLQNKENKCVPRHQLWNWDDLLDRGFLLKESTPDKLSDSRLVKQLFMENYKQQLKVIRNKDVDVLYAPFMGDAYFIALLKTLHLYNKPLIAIAQDTWDLNSCSSKFNKLKYRFLRYIAKHGVDRLLFISENLYEQCRSYFNDSTRQIPLTHWGVDYSYYDDFSCDCNVGIDNYIYVTGGSNRDFSIMQKTASILPGTAKILIQTNREFDLKETDNLIIDRSPKGWNDLLAGYKGSLAVAVPLQQQLSYMSGITVVLEGMACRKPILSTVSPHYPFDIEKEKVGFCLPFDDALAWKDAIEYLSSHKDEAREMGERGRWLIENKHNYSMFCQELVKHINSL